ncbi:MAG: hypothetical protein JNN11_03270 [Candidatus Doudnabacteria bacterium]|nr:hypothetical protein [Candidatus Doudnabacteria bacterium]
MKRLRKNQIYGFSLLETLLYLAVSGSILLASVQYTAFIFKARVKFVAMSEVQEQGGFVLKVLTQALRNAEVLNAPSIGTNGDTLTLAPYGGSGETITFRLSDSKILKSEALSDTPLTNSKVIVTNLNFSNLSRNNTPATVQIHFRLETVGGGSEYTYSSDFYSSASLQK